MQPLRKAKVAFLGAGVGLEEVPPFVAPGLVVWPMEEVVQGTLEGRLAEHIRSGGGACRTYAIVRPFAQALNHLVNVSLAQSADPAVRGVLGTQTVGASGALE